MIPFLFFMGNFVSYKIKLCIYKNIEMRYSCIRNIKKGYGFMKLQKTVSGSIRLGRNDHHENKATQTLKNELAKGIYSMKKGEVYTLDEAWKEIDLI